MLKININTDIEIVRLVKEEIKKLLELKENERLLDLKTSQIMYQKNRKVWLKDNKNKYYCSCCDFHTAHKTNYELHLNRKKHKRLYQEDIIIKNSKK